MAVALIFWVRGRETSWGWRNRLAGIRAKQHRWWLLPALAAWIGLGAWNYYNTKVLNEVTGSDQMEEDAVFYEKTYKKYEGIAQPHYTDIRFTIDLVPATRSLRSVAEVTVKNKGREPIDSLHLNMGGGGIEQDATIPGADLVLNDERVNYRIYKLAKPLMPGEELHFTVTSTHEEKGFENNVSAMQLNHNGTFFNNMDVLPMIGYTANGELQDKNDRKDHDLPPKERMPRLTSDSLTRMQQYLMPNSDWVNVRTVISTTPDQIAIAPGSLKREWTENGKRYFEYVVDHPSMNFYSFMSANTRCTARSGMTWTWRCTTTPHMPPMCHAWPTASASRWPTTPRTSDRTATSRRASSNSRATRASHKPSPAPCPTARASASSRT
jgi:ABC-2 type transport system permease protein